MQSLPIKKLSPHAVLPTRATTGSAGYDLYACLPQPVTVPAGTRVPIPTGIAIGITEQDIAAFVYARSGLACKLGITPANCVGVVDSDYRGEITVVLQNNSDTDFTVSQGDRIAQMVFSRVLLPTLSLTESLDETTRGRGGFGSTGIGDNHEF